MSDNNNKMNSYKRHLILLYVVIALGVALAIIFGVKQSIKTTKLITTIETQDSLKQVLETKLNLAEASINEMQLVNDSLNKQYLYYRSLVKRLRAQVRNAVSREQLKQANSRIVALENELLALREENEKLKGENATLAKDKEEFYQKTIVLQQEVDTLESENSDLTDKVEIASTLMVGNFILEGIKSANGIVKVTSTAKKLTALRLKFEILENRVTSADEGVFYFEIIGPDGSLLTDSASKGQIQLVDGSQITYGQSKSIPYTRGERSAQIYDISVEGGFKPGNYSASIYNNGYKVAQTALELKKGFLFF